MNGMNRIYIILFLVILMTSVFEMTGVLSTADFKIEQVVFRDQASEVKALDEFHPMRLSVGGREALNILVRPNGYQISAIINLQVASNKNDSKKVFYRVGNRLGSIKCNKFKEDKELHCALPVTFGAKADTRVVLFADQKDITILQLDIKEYKAKRASQLSGTVVFYFFLILSVLGFLLSFLKDQAAKIVLLVVATVCLSLLSLPIFFLILVFLLIFYCLLCRILKGEVSKRSYFLMAFFALVFLLIFIKFLTPLAPMVFQNPGDLPLAIPLGFSYFIIKIIDLTIDCYKGYLKELSLLDYLCYLLFPCTLPAGPIKTFKQYQSFRIEQYSSLHYASGIARTLFGVIKKLLADIYILPIINAKMLLFVNSNSADPAQQSLLVFQMLLWNFIYIYLDFSAYCDMAIGSARAMGFNVPENFRWPLLRTSVSEYWQHWHMTLSNWARKNVFMNVVLSTRSLFFATFSTMLCIGLWHKPSFGWFSWAFHHTLIMRIEDYVKRHKLVSRHMDCFPALTRNLFALASVFYVWFMVALGQSFIIFSDMDLSLKAYKSMLEAPYYLLKESFMLMF